MHAYYDDWIDIGGSVRINQLGRKFGLSVSIGEIIYKFALNKYTHTFTIMLREKKKEEEERVYMQKMWKMICNEILIKIAECYLAWFNRISAHLYLFI